MTMMPNRFILSLLFLVALSFRTSMAAEVTKRPFGNSACDGKQRVRMHWDEMTNAQKDTYNRAITESIRLKLFQRFAEFHASAFGGTIDKPHGSCRFPFWHRHFLLAFENMLRDVGDKCVTLPYFDVPGIIGTSCTSIGCVKMVKELVGGRKATSTPPVGTVFQLDNNRAERAAGHVCYTMPSTFCMDNNANCGCLLRNDLDRTRVDTLLSQSNLDELYKISFASFGNKIHDYHNHFHTNMGGFFGSTSMASLDPLFYSWHSYIDMAVTKYHWCWVTDFKTVRKDDRGVFTNRNNLCSGGSTDTTTPSARLLRTLRGKDASDDPLIGKYFRALTERTYGENAFPHEYGDYAYVYSGKPSEAFEKRLTDKNICTAPKKRKDGNLLEPDAILTAAADADKDKDKNTKKSASSFTNRPSVILLCFSIVAATFLQAAATCLQH